VLFLCARNAVRSQLAEALVNHFFGDQWEAHSAGAEPAEQVHPLVIQVLKEWAIDVAPLRPKRVSEFGGQSFDLIITVSDESEPGPVWPGPGRLRHVWFPDPSRMRGSPGERLDVFRQARNGIWHAVREHLHAHSRVLTPQR
jgi:arsenate reductase